MCSKLYELLQLSKANIDWGLCDQFAMSNMVKKVAQLWNDGLSKIEIVKQTGLSKSAVYSYLRKAAKFQWCNYDAAESYKRKGLYKSGKNHSLAKQVIRLSDNKIYNSCTQAGLDNDIPETSMCRYCKLHKGFKYYDEWLMLQND